MYDTGDYSISDLAELFSISRPTPNRRLDTGATTAYDVCTGPSCVPNAHCAR